MSVTGGLMGLQAEVSRAVLEEPPLCLPLLLLSGCFFSAAFPHLHYFLPFWAVSTLCRTFSKAVSLPLATLPTCFSIQCHEGHSSSSSSGCCIMHRAQQKSQVNDGPPVVSHDMLESGRWCYFRLPSVKMMRSAVILLLSAGGISRAGGSLRLLTWTPKQQQWVPFLLSLLSPPIWKVMARDFQMFFIHYALMHAFI